MFFKFSLSYRYFKKLIFSEHMYPKEATQIINYRFMLKFLFRTTICRLSFLVYYRLQNNQENEIVISGN